MIAEEAAAEKERAKALKEKEKAAGASQSSGSASKSASLWVSVHLSNPGSFFVDPHADLLLREYSGALLRLRAPSCGRPSTRRRG